MKTHHRSIFSALVAGALVLSLASRARADDDRTLISDAHKKLAHALNLGGPTPSDDDRTADIKDAISDLKDLDFALGRANRVRDMAVKDLKAALDEISHGDPDKSAENEIRDADSIVRDLES